MGRDRMAVAKSKTMLAIEFWLHTSVVYILLVDFVCYQACVQLTFLIARTPFFFFTSRQRNVCKSWLPCPRSSLRDSVAYWRFSAIKYRRNVSRDLVVLITWVWSIVWSQSPHSLHHCVTRLQIHEVWLVQTTFYYLLACCDLGEPWFRNVLR
jgi:hypothetical protein